MSVEDVSNCFCCDGFVFRYWLTVRGGPETLFARLLRAELVMRAPVSLNPDAFSGFRGTRGTVDDSAFASDCEDVKTAATTLLVGKEKDWFFVRI